jgi:hypothetical protein
MFAYRCCPRDTLQGVPLTSTSTQENIMDALFTAVDITGLSTNISTLMLGFIGVGLLFVGRRYLGRTAKMPV